MHFFFATLVSQPSMPLLVGPWQYRPIGAKRQPMSANSNKASLSPSCSARYKWTLSTPNRWLHFDAYFVNAQWTEWKKWERIVQLLKSINSSHNPNLIPNLWLGFSKDPKVLRNKDLPPPPRPKGEIQNKSILINKFQIIF